MNVIAKDVKAAGFDAVAWRKRLLALNPWAQGLAIDEGNAEFVIARQRATHDRHAEAEQARRANEEHAGTAKEDRAQRARAGARVWNTWADGMLALRSELEGAGQWAAQRKRLGTQRRPVGWDPLLGENQPTREWLALACTAFSTGKGRNASLKGEQHHFDKDVSFEGYTFPSDAEFEGARFSGAAQFGYAKFCDIANFTSATFKRAWFGHAELCGYARFGEATFCDYAWFDGAVTFFRDAWFRGATFEKGAYFSDARFDCTEDRDTDKALRPSDHSVVDFEQAKFKGEVLFDGSRFAQSASFKAIDSSAAFSLAGASFRRVPNLFAASFKGALRLDNVKTPRYLLTLGYTPDRDATAHFRELRRRAAEARDRDRELEFFAQELRTGRFHASGLPPWVPKVWSWRFWSGLGFGALSNFGRSLWRPVLWWLALTAVFFALFLGEHEDMRKARAALGPDWSSLGAYAVTTARAWASPPACRIQDREPFASTDAVTEAIQLSLRNALVLDIGRADSARRIHGCLFGLEKEGDQHYAPVSARVSNASTLQALASGLLIFLFLLAVRNLLRLQ